MSFLAPLFLGGLLLIAIPWLVHRIRRPERETVRFSSLMFVPDVKHEVIERRRLQHVLLMLLRMALLVVLALAFARPFREVILGADTPAAGVTYHAIVLDASLSMASGYWDGAKDAAMGILEDVEPGDRVAVVRFARTAMIDVPMTEDLAFARQAIGAAEATWERGDFLVGLQAAGEVLGSVPDVRRVVHLISDFQATGLPESETGWHLPADIVFEPVGIGEPAASNASVEAVAVRPMREAWQVRARVKNWSGASALTVRLTVTDRVVDTRSMVVPAGNASQVRFEVPLTDGPIWGAVDVVQDDALLADNRRFFAWQPAPKPRVLALRSPVGRVNRLLEAALPDDGGLRLNFSDVRTFARDLEMAPDVVIAGGLDGLSDSAQHALMAYVRNGSKLFLPLDESAGVEALNAVLTKAGVRVDGLHLPRPNPSTFSELAWVDLDHPIFQPFRGPQFNDFSTVHYTHFHRLTVLADGPTVLAKFEDDAPAMVEADLGEGRVLIWAGGFDLDRTNLARTPRFVPLLHETLSHLIGSSREETAFDVGDIVGGSVTRVSPNAQSVDGRMDVPGVYRRDQSDASLWLAAHVDAAESDPTRVQAEFEIRLCDAPVLVRDGVRVAADARVEQWEYGLWALAVLMGLLVVEQFYAAWLDTTQQEPIG